MKDKFNRCNICGDEVKDENGGGALMVVFCRHRATNLTNIGFCGSCYKTLLQEPIRKLADAACVDWLGVEDEDE